MSSRAHFLISMSFGVLVGLLVGPAVANGSDAVTPCAPETCPLRTLRTLGGPVPDLIGDADDAIEDRGAQEPDVATPFKSDTVGANRELLLRRLGRDAPRNRIGHY